MTKNVAEVLEALNMKIMRRGEIWLFNSDLTIGDEIGKIRPAIIVNSDEIGAYG